jgi:hypothetical protein
MIVFVILLSKVQFIFSEISEQDAPLLFLGLFLITTLEFLSNQGARKQKRKKMDNSWNIQTTQGSHSLIFST